MAIVQKTSPVDVDLIIDYHQSYLFNNLSVSGLTNSTDWESMPRVYKNPWKRGKMPELYLGDGEYREVFYDDRFKMSSFYIVGDTRTLDEGLVQVDVSLIVQADIAKIYPTILHRADEELNNRFVSLSENYGGADSFELTGIVNGVENVYSEFLTDNVGLDDMSNQYVVRFNYSAQYIPRC
jgi:hypothetical protein